MRAYLFGWNPAKFKWDDIDDDIQTLKETGRFEDDWSVVSHRSVQPGDRAYIIRVGLEPKGIFASGTIVSAPYQAVKRGRTHFRVNIALDVLLNPAKEAILSLESLKTGNLAAQMWTPQASGIAIRPQLVDGLEGVWLNFLADNNKVELL